MPPPAKICAIHQPNFFPWLGYFDKIRRADVFVFLDAVAYPRSGSGGMGSWTNRVRLKVNGEARWVTCPLRRMPLGAPIGEAMIDDTQPWRRKLLKTLQANYGRAPSYQTAMTLLEPLIGMEESNLSRFNMAAIQAIAAHLDVAALFLAQSEVSHEGEGNRLLASLVKSVGTDTYLMGGGAAGYHDERVFQAAGVAVKAQDFRPVPYGATETFLPGLSVIDYLMHDGRPLAEAFDSHGRWTAPR